MEGSEVVIFRLCQSKVEALDLRGNLHLGYSLWSQHQGRQFKTFETKLQQELKKKKLGRGIDWQCIHDLFQNTI